MRLWTGCGTMVLLLVAGAAFAQSPPAAAPTSPAGKVAVWLHVAPHPALTPHLVAQVEAGLARKLTILLGQQVSEPAPPPDAAQAWLADHDLSELDARLCQDWGCAVDGKTLWVDLRYERATWRLAAVEYDDHFGALGLVRAADLVQRELVSDALATLALRCYTPVGLLTGVRSGSAVVAFADVERLTAPSPWRRLAPGTVLQVVTEAYKRPSPGEPLAIEQLARQQFLRVDKVGAGEVLADPVGAGSTSTGSWLSTAMKQSQVRYLARCVDAPAGPLSVRVLVEGTRTPREGCEVFVLEDVPRHGNLGTAQALTDPEGEAVVHTRREGLSYVAVVYGKALFSRVIVRGSTPDQLEFFVPSQEPRLVVERLIRNLQAEVLDRQGNLSDLLARLKVASDASDKAAADALTAQSKKIVDLLPLHKALAGIQVQASSTNVDVTQDLAELTKQVKTFESQVASAGLGEATRVAEINGLTKQFDQLWQQKRDWPTCHKLLKRLVELDPSNQVSRDSLQTLEEGLVVNGPAHQAARDTLDAAAKIAAADEFIKKWSGLNDALIILLREQDQFWLLTANSDADRWEMFLAQEQQRLATDLEQAKNDPMAANKSELAQRQQTLADCAKQLTAHLQAIENFLKPPAAVPPAP